MAKLVYGLQQSLDGYVDHLQMRPTAAIFRHFEEHVRGLAAIVYGRRTYEVMRYWDEDQADWEKMGHDFAASWRSKPKWVVSRTLKTASSTIGPNATLVSDDVEATIRRLKSEFDGEIDVAGPDLAGSLGGFGLIDEYRLYLRPLVLGSGTPYFSGPRPPLRFLNSEVITEDMLRLTYVPA